MTENKEKTLHERWKEDEDIDNEKYPIFNILSEEEKEKYLKEKEKKEEK